MKKLRLFSLATLLLTSCQLVLAEKFSAVNADGVKIYYDTLDETTCEVTLSDDWTEKYAGVVRIPAQVSDGTNDYDVVGIGQYAFEWCEELTSVELPNSQYKENKGNYRKQK